MDGLRGADEGGYAGATITLDNDAAGVHRTLTSTENGQYRFDRLLAGTYTLTVTLPESAMFTLPDGDSQFTGRLRLLPVHQHRRIHGRNLCRAAHRRDGRNNA